MFMPDSNLQIGVAYFALTFVHATEVARTVERSKRMLGYLMMCCTLTLANGYFTHAFEMHNGLEEVVPAGTQIAAGALISVDESDLA